MFSVLVPTYNQAQYLGQALDSLVAQTDADWEAVVVDDGSSDGTADILDSYSRRDKRFKVLHQPNGGVATALNNALAHATGQWICWLSSDDLFHRQKLSVHRNAIHAHPEKGFFVTGFDLLYASGRSTLVPGLRLNDTRWLVLDMLHRNVIAGNSVCVDRQLFRKVGVFDSSLPHAQDYDMWLRLMAVTMPAAIPDSTCITRLHAAQGSATFPSLGQFDSGRASIALLNSYRLEDLLPSVNLREPALAHQALCKALSVAADPASAVYGLGPHPALLRRVVEWILSVPDATLSRDLSRMLRLWAREVAGTYPDSAFSTMWQEAISEFTGCSGSPAYRAVSVADVAVQATAALTGAGVRMIRRYEEYYRQLDPRCRVAQATESGSDLLSHRTTEVEATVETPTCVARPESSRSARLASWLCSLKARRRWLPFSAVFAALRCRPLASSPVWWKYVARQTALVPEGAHVILTGLSLLRRAVSRVGCRNSPHMHSASQTSLVRR